MVIADPGSSIFRLLSSFPLNIFTVEMKCVCPSLPITMHLIRSSGFLALFKFGLLRLSKIMLLKHI